LNTTPFKPVLNTMLRVTLLVARVRFGSAYHSDTLKILVPSV